VLLAGFWFALSAPGERTPQMQSSPPTHASPASAGSAYSSEPNTPALVAFVASLIFPLAIAVDALAVLIVVNRGPYILQSAAILVGGMVSVCGAPSDSVRHHSRAYRVRVSQTISISTCSSLDG